MKLNLTSKFKLLQLPFTTEIPNFTILTGVNGAGKTPLFSELATRVI